MCLQVLRATEGQIWPITSKVPLVFQYLLVIAILTSHYCSVSKRWLARKPSDEPQIDLIFKMADRFPQCRFTVLGNTPAMRYERVPPNVSLHGFVPYEKLPAFYARHRFYLQLSIWEGFPSAPCEAMLCECVPIASTVAALPEIVGDAGFLLERKDPDRLKELIDQALGADLDSLGKKARKRIREKFPPAERRKFLALVEEMVGKGRTKG